MTDASEEIAYIALSVTISRPAGTVQEVLDRVHNAILAAFPEARHELETAVCEHAGGACDFCERGGTAHRPEEARRE